MKNVSSTISSINETVFSRMTQLANKHNAINLSQGFPDFDGPEWIKSLAINAINEGKNQYAPGNGILPLRKTLSEVYQTYYQLQFDYDKEVTITNGATEGIFSTILALVNPGDEVIIIEPFYDSYLAAITIARGKAIPIKISIENDQFQINFEDLEKSFSNKTKLVILNNPHNPSGKVFKKEELKKISDLIIKNDCFVLADEVYEFLTFDQSKHIPIASLPNMKERTITVSSSGKTFGLTGWKVGWCMASEEVSHAIRMVHQFNTFSICQPVQWAFAEALEKLDRYIPQFIQSYSEKKEYFTRELKSLGIPFLMPEGTYFVLAKMTKKNIPNDLLFCEELIKNYGVATVPLSPFYLSPPKYNNYVRFCFAKKRETLTNAIQALKKFPIT